MITLNSLIDSNGFLAIISSTTFLLTSPCLLLLGFHLHARPFYNFPWDTKVDASVPLPCSSDQMHSIDTGCVTVHLILLLLVRYLYPQLSLESLSLEPIYFTLYRERPPPFYRRICMDRVKGKTVSSLKKKDQNKQENPPWGNLNICREKELPPNLSFIAQR